MSTSSSTSTRPRSAPSPSISRSKETETSSGGRVNRPQSCDSETNRLFRGWLQPIPGSAHEWTLMEVKLADEEHGDGLGVFLREGPKGTPPRVDYP